MNNLRKHLQKYLYPETHLSNLINKEINSVYGNFDYNSMFRGVVLEYASSSNQITDTDTYDKSNFFYAINYPQNYIRAFVLGLDEGLYEQWCRVFRPASQIDTEKVLNRGDLITITFDDPNFSSGIWLGKINDTIDTGSFFSLLQKYDINSRINLKKYDSNEELKNIIEAKLVLHWPVDIMNREVTSPYGPRNIGDGFHSGVDLRGRQGFNVLAAEDGYVVNIVDVNPSSYTPFGYDDKNRPVARISEDSYKYTYIKIEHKKLKESDEADFGFIPEDRISADPFYYKYNTVYGHVFKILFKKGDFVKRGQKIAEISPYLSEGSTAPHLHFVVEYEGEKVNPMENQIAILSLYSVN